MINIFHGKFHTPKSILLLMKYFHCEQTPYSSSCQKYEGFDLIDADENSARVTMVLKCQTPQNRTKKTYHLATNIDLS